MDARKLLEENLALIESAIRYVARRQHLDESEVEDFASTVKLKLVENDCAILRKFQGRSQFRTFITIVVKNMLFDYRIHLWGKWHASAEAKRLGDVAIELELLLLRDGHTIDDVLPRMRGRHPEVTRESLEALADRLPERRARRRMVDLSEAETVAVEPETEEHVLMAEREETSKRLSSAMREAIAKLSDDDRLFLQLRFESGFTVADIARSMQIDQKLLYRRMEKLLRDLRADLERSGIDPGDVADLIGRDGTALDFDLETPPDRPSNPSKGSVAARRKKVTR